MFFSQYFIITKRLPLKNQRIAKQVAAQINHQFRPVNRQVSQYREDTQTIVKRDLRHADPKSLFVVVGPDSFLNEVLNAIESLIQQNTKPIPLSYITTDSNSIFARKYHLSLNWRKSLKQILSDQQIKMIPVGYFNENLKKKRRYFLTDAGIGFNTNLIKAIQHPRSFRDKVKTFGTIINLLYNLQSFPLTIYRKHRKPIHLKKVFLISVTITKQAQLKLTIIKHKNFLAMMVFFLAMTLKQRDHLHILSQVVKSRLHIEISALEYGNTDNEEIGGQYYDLSFHVTQYPFYF